MQTVVRSGSRDLAVSAGYLDSVANVENSIQGQVRAGNITAAKAPKYSDIVDLTIFTDAQALVKKTGA